MSRLNYVVIGASSGFGREIAIQLADEGHHVFGTYLKNKPDDLKTNISFHTLDVVSDNNDLSFLPDVIDGLVYCPGSINLKPFARIKPQEFADDFDMQVLGAVRVLQAALPKLKAAGNPSVVLFSTVAVQQGFNFHSMVSASKGAIEGLTKALAAEFAPKIRINCIAPSLTDTPLAHFLVNSDEKRKTNDQRHPLKRIGKTEDIANMAAFLLSPKASWITGQILHVDGGMSTLRV